jgi:drug/metabolite transporter (DMT)-like permease
MTGVRRNIEHPLSLLLVQILFGLFPIAAKEVFHDIDPLPVLGLRLAGAAFFLMALHIVLVRNPIPIRTEWKGVLGLSLLGVVINMGFFLVGLQYTTPVNAVVVITTIPVFTYTIALLMGREKVSPARATGIAVALAGVLYLIGSSFQASKSHALGDLMVMVNALSYAAFLVLARPMTQKYDPLSLTTWMFIVGTMVFLPLGLALGLRGQLANASSGTMGWMIFIILGASVLTYVLNTRVLRHVPASTVAIFTYVQPILTAVMAYFILGSTLDPKILPAAALIFAGVWLVARKPDPILEGQAVSE